MLLRRLRSVLSVEGVQLGIEEACEFSGRQSDWNAWVQIGCRDTGDGDGAVEVVTVEFAVHGVDEDGEGGKGWRRGWRLSVRRLVVRIGAFGQGVFS